MKISIFLLAATLLAGCFGKTSTPKPKGNTITWDSAYTVIEYSFDWRKNDHRTTTAMHGIAEILKPDSANPERNVYEKEDVYRIPFFRDSVDKTGKPVKDSSGRTYAITHWIDLPKDLLLTDYKKKFK